MRGIGMMAAVHLVGNALLLWLGYYWLGIGESRAATLVWSALVALALVAAACWLHGGTLAYFRAGARPGDGARAWGSAPRVLALVVAAAGVFAVYLLVARLKEWSADPAYGLASWLTLKLRKPVKPVAMLRLFAAAFRVLRWIVIPVFVLPVAADIASAGWSGWRAFGRLAGKWRYWVQAPVLLLCALWAPFALVGWVPRVGGFGMEMASFVARILVAYLLFTASWLLLEFVTSGGKPVLSQPKTEAKP